MQAQTQHLFAYPPAHRDDTLTDFHGTPVADPYRWLEEQDAPKTRRWVAAQQELAGAFLAACPARAQIAGRLAALWAFPKRSTPWRDPSIPTESIEIAGLPCRPCDQRVCAPGDYRCLAAIRPADVIAAAERVLR